MGASESKPSNPVLARIEQEAVRAAVPRGLKDEQTRQLEHELNWCYNRNSWYFTVGGLLLGLTMGYSTRSVQPVAWAAILAPGADWLYSQHACAELQETYNKHLRRVRDTAHEQAERARAEVRQQYDNMMAAGGAEGGAGLPAVPAAAAAAAAVSASPAGEPLQAGAAAVGTAAPPAQAPAEGPGQGGRRSWWSWRWGGRQRSREE